MAGFKIKINLDVSRLKKIIEKKQKLIQKNIHTILKREAIPLLIAMIMDGYDDLSERAEMGPDDPTNPANWRNEFLLKLEKDLERTFIVTGDRVSVRLGDKDFLGYDPSGKTASQADIDESPIRIIRELLGGHALPGVVPWDLRRNVLLSMLNRMIRGMAALQINPKCVDLLKALEGRWYYPQDKLGRVSKDLPKKPNHPWEDYGDATIEMLERVPSVVLGTQGQKVPEPVIGDPMIGY